MRLTVLGCYGPYPPAGGCCSGYLLQEEGCSLLLDCGNGVLSRLQKHQDYRELDAILVSHLHADHMSDIMIMRYGLQLAIGEGLRSESLPLYAPGSPEIEFERLTYKSAYNVNMLKAGNTVQIGPFTILAGEGIHSVSSMAIRIRTSSGLIVYSGDTEYYPGLSEFAIGADIFLCEANYLEKDIASNLTNHLSSAQAAQIAAKAGVKRLILTHHHPDRDLERSLIEAQKYFPAAEQAREGEVYTI